MNQVSDRGPTHILEAGMVPALAELFGRILLACLFLISGFGKLGQYNGTADYMTSAGVPNELLPLVITLEILGATALIVGWRTRAISLLLAGFTLTATAIFHNDVSDAQHFLNLLKNLSIVGGLLLLVARGAGNLSLDRRSLPKHASASTADTIV